MLDAYVISKQKRQPATMHARVCAFCGEPFTARHSDAKYCKNACRIAAQKPAKHATTCAECGKAIVSKYPRKYCSNGCRNAWWNHNHFAPKKRRACTCGNFRRCSECRRRAQAKEDPTVSLSPDVLAICLEVRAQNSRKHQPAARAVAGD
jgi:hypothetical protein